MSTPRIYKSAYPDYVVPRQSVFSKLFPSEPWYQESLPAFIDAASGRTLSRGDVRDLSLRVGYGVRNSLKTKRGDTIMVFRCVQCLWSSRELIKVHSPRSPNSLSWPITLFGCVAAGLRCTLANSSYTPSELAHQLNDSGAGYVFVHPALLQTLFKAFEVLNVPANEANKRVILMNFGEKAPAGMESFVQLDSLLRGGKLQEEENFDGDLSNETVYLCYSSGTTGLSKGVEYVPTPLIFFMQNLTFAKFTFGIPVVVSPPFNPVDFCSYIQKYKVTCSLIVPPVLVLLASHPAVDKYDLSSLKFFFSGAAPLGAELIARVQARLRTRGANVIIPQGYGLTETSPTCLLLPAGRADEKVGSAGELLPNMEVRLVGEDGVDVKEGEAGEFWLRSASVMKGYLNNPAATEHSITSDGWFKTGDIAVRDKDGFFTIVDRLKELIKYKGFQVPPADLENVLLTHPDIIDAGVIGVYSEEQATELPRLTDRLPRIADRFSKPLRVNPRHPLIIVIPERVVIRGYVVHRRGYASLSKSERDAFAKGVQTWIQGKVAKHKFLRGGVAVIEAIPKSAAGKILRRQLRDLAKKELAEASVKAKL
ncbi:hypothetical protein FRC10_007254 [Ceratobasidium sp. 414]|nr:hypothetical protein FRC10_007254 [Ceratobasidium sp. 414]